MKQRKQLNTIWVIVILLLCMGIATGIGLTVFTHTSLRLDEAQSLFQTNRDVAGMLHVVGQDVHVPGYHILLHYWQVVFGNDIYTARLLSLIFFVATIPAVYWLTVYAFSRRDTALFASILVTISPFMQWYGSEARMYSMLAFFVVLHQIAFLKIFREGKPVHWVWYILTAILGMYAHYFFVFIIFAEIVFYCIYRTSFAAKKALLKFVVAAIILVAALAPWLLYVVSLGFAGNTQPHLQEPTSVDLFNTYAQFMFGFQVDAFNTILVSLWPIAMLLAFFGLQKNHHVPREAIYFVLAATIPVLGAFIVSILVTPFFQSRYLIVALPSLLIFVAWATSVYPRTLAIPLRIGLVIGVVGLLVVQIASPNTPVKEEYKEAVHYLNEKTTSQDVIILAAPFTVYPTEYYYTGSAKLTTHPVWDRFSQGAVPAFNESTLGDDIKKSTQSYQTVWVMLSYDQGYNETIRRYMDSHYERTNAREFSKGLWVYSYRLRYDPAITISPAQ